MEILSKNNYFKPDPNFKWPGLKPDHWGKNSIKTFHPLQAKVFSDGKKWFDILLNYHFIEFLNQILGPAEEIKARRHLRPQTSKETTYRPGLRIIPQKEINQEM